MKYLVDSKQMKQIDTYTIDSIGIPSCVLMERAALAVTHVISSKINQDLPILIAVGTGNNGADGLAVARQLLSEGYQVHVVVVGDKTSASDMFLLQYQILEKLSVPCIPFCDFSRKENSYGAVVDAIFGVGLSRPIEGEYADAILFMNQQSGCKIAVDIPSGVNGTTGAILGCAFRADITVTFAYHKLGLFFAPGYEYCGEILCEDIGIPPQVPGQLGMDTVFYTSEDMERLPMRTPHSNKGTYGRVAVIAGTKNMAGAACLAGRAAYYTGCGLVEIVTEEVNRTIVQSTLPEAVLQTYETEAEADAVLEKVCRHANAIVIGPGLGDTDMTLHLLEYVLCHAHVPLLIDADGLNVLARHMDLLGKKQAPVIVTPHVKEMSRMLGEEVSRVSEELLPLAKMFAARYDCICVLKDFHTVIANPQKEAYINMSGNHGMAKAGSGDVLAGMIGALLAQGMEPYEAARLGVFLHGCAGDDAVKTTGTYSLTAMRLIESIRTVTGGN